MAKIGTDFNRLNCARSMDHSHGKLYVTHVHSRWLNIKMKKKLISGNVVNAETDEEKKQRNVFHRTKLLVVLPYLNNCDIFRPELNAINAILCAYSSRFHVTCHVFWKV